MKILWITILYVIFFKKNEGELNSTLYKPTTIKGILNYNIICKKNLKKIEKGGGGRRPSPLGPSGQQVPPPLLIEWKRVEKTLSRFSSFNNLILTVCHVIDSSEKVCLHTLPFPHMLYTLLITPSQPQLSLLDFTPFF